MTLHAYPLVIAAALVCPLAVADPLPELKRRLSWWHVRAQHAALSATSPAFRAVRDRPVFIVGCGHSGTSIMLRIIGAHPQIYPILDESYVFATGDRAATARNLKRFDLLAHQAGRRHWVEKTPTHIHRIGSILEQRPEARVLLMIRDGRDAAVSLRDRFGDLRLGIQRWIDDNTAGEAWWDHPQVMRIRYEDVVTDFQNTVGSALAFIGEAFRDEVREYYKRVAPEQGAPATPPPTEADHQHLDYRMWQVQQPLFDGRAKWASRMTEQEKQIFKEMAGDMLIRYGYATDLSW